MSDWRSRAARAGKWPLSPGGHGPGPGPRAFDGSSGRAGRRPASLARSVVDAAVYREGRRIATPVDAGGDLRASCPGSRAPWRGSGCTGPLQRSSGGGRASSTCTSWPSRTPSWPTSGRSWSATATRCSSCCAPARYLDEAEEVDFGELHLFVGPDFVITVRHSESPDLSRCAAGWRATPSCWRWAREAVLYAILDARRRRIRAGGRRASRTTSTRSRPRSSAATRRSPGASTSSPARSSSSSGPPGR